jgi:hypothetical protein
MPRSDGRKLTDPWTAATSPIPAIADHACPRPVVALLFDREASTAAAEQDQV